MSQTNRLHTGQNTHKRPKNEERCATCLRCTALTFHHLIPRKMHRRNFFKKHFNKADLQNGILVCRQCHSGIHKHYDEMHLAKHLNSLEKLRSDAMLTEFFKWVARQKIAAPTLS